MQMRREIRFLRRGKVIRLAPEPTTTLLDHLRLGERATGTKEGCAEGDCGACTVVLRKLRGNDLVYEPVNACIFLAGQADGCDVVTVEDLAAGRRLHPVQQAMVEAHGSQCGFCTPGIVMSLYALANSGRPAGRQEVLDQLAGNLCRCTGYRPIIDAALSVLSGEAIGAVPAAIGEVRAALGALADGEDVQVGDDARFFAAPASLDALCDVAAAHPDAVLVAGATDVGLWVTKELRDIRKVIWLGRVAGLDRIEDHPDRLVIGATATYAEAEPALAAIDPDLGELVRRIGGKQVRAAGTIGGNIANGSPIGDTPPALIALGATVHLRHGRTTRSMPLEAFFLDYKKQDRRPGEVVTGVEVPKLRAGEAFRAFKLSKRFDSDISGVMVAIKVTREGERIAAARLAFGGMAGTPKRAVRTEAALASARLDDRASWRAALDALAQDFTPLDDHRASAAYRLAAARGLVEKALVEIAGADTRTTRLVGHREADRAAE